MPDVRDRLRAAAVAFADSPYEILRDELLPADRAVVTEVTAAWRTALTGVNETRWTGSDGVLDGVGYLFEMASAGGELRGSMGNPPKRSRPAALATLGRRLGAYSVARREESSCLRREILMLAHDLR